MADRTAEAVSTIALAVEPNRSHCLFPGQTRRIRAKQALSAAGALPTAIDKYMRDELAYKVMWFHVKCLKEGSKLVVGKESHRGSPWAMS